MKVSICIATHDKPAYLRRTLESIYHQPITDSGDVEVIVVDDRGADAWNSTVCNDFPVKYIRIDGEEGYRNPAKARNVAYRAAIGDVIIAESDDTIQVTKNCIEKLVEELTPGHFVIANVINTDLSSNPVSIDIENPGYGKLLTLTGPNCLRPLFFLGSLYRRDLYAVGGNDEDFVAPSGEDQWFALCLMRGLKLEPIFSETIVGHHLQHQHKSVKATAMPSGDLLKKKMILAMTGQIPWQSSSGPWPYINENTPSPSHQADSLPVAVG